MKYGKNYGYRCRFCKRKITSVVKEEGYYIHAGCGSRCDWIDLTEFEEKEIKPKDVIKGFLLTKKGCRIIEKND